MIKLKRQNFFLNRTYTDNTIDNGLLEKVFIKTTDNMLYEEAFGQLLKDKRNETVNYYLNQDEQDLFKFDSIYNYFDVDQLVYEEHNNNEDSAVNKIFNDIIEEAFASDEDDGLDIDELEKVKRNVFTELVCSDITDVLQSYLDGTEKANKNVAKDYIKEIAPGYVEKQIEAQALNHGKDTAELIKLFKKRQSNLLAKD